MTWATIGGAAITTAGSLLGGSSGPSGPYRGYRKDVKRAVGRAETLSNRPYQAYTGQRVAGLSGNERMAGNLARDYDSVTRPYLDRLSGYTQFDPGALSQYENPYLDRVLEARRRVIGEEFGRQSADLSRRQSAMDAFRTGRSDLARSRLEEARMRALDEAEAEARAGAFQTALGAYQNQQRLGATTDLGALGTALQARNNQIGALAATGGTERGINQAQLDFDYGQFLEGRDWDVNNFGILLDALRTAQGGPTGQQGPSDASLLAGLLGTAVSNGAFDSLFKNWGNQPGAGAYTPGAGGVGPVLQRTG